MSRTMFDSIRAHLIPSGARMVAGYVDGMYAWSASDWAKFPGAVRVGIACLPGTNDGHVLDIERGDATPAQAPGWVSMRRRAGVDPSVYCSMSNWPVVQAEFAGANVAEPHYWLACPSGTPALVAGSVATQYAYMGKYDVSIVADWWPGVDNGQTWPGTPAALAHPATPAPPTDANAKLRAIRDAVFQVLRDIDDLLTIIP